MTEQTNVKFAEPTVSAELWETLKLGAPLVVTQLAVILVTAANVANAGKLGQVELAVLSLSNSIYYVVFMTAIGIAAAVSPLVAQAVGRKTRMLRDIRRSVRQGFWLMLIIGAIGATILWQAEALLRLFGQAPLLAAKAGAFSKLTVFWLMPALLFVVLRNFVTAISRPRIVMGVTIVGCVVNGGLGFALSQGVWGFPDLGIQGIAVATACTNSLMFLITLGYVYADRRIRRFHVLGNFWQPDWQRLRTLFRLGLPIGATIGVEVALFSTAALLMGILGSEELAAHQIALQLASIAFMIPVGLGQAASVRVGMAAGAGDAHWVDRAGWTSICLGVGIALCSALAFWFAPGTFIGFFINRADPDNAPVVALAVTYLAVAAFFQLADAAQALGAGVLRGLRDTKMPMIYAVVGYWAVGFPIAYFLGLHTDWRGLGVWFGLATSLLVVSGLMVRRFARRRHLAIGPLH